VTMKRSRRPVALVLGICILAASSGCYSGADYAMENSLRLSAGMTMDEVQGRLGEPDLIVRGDPGTETVWVYRYEDGASVVCWIVAFIFVVALIAVLVFAKGGGGGGGWGGGGGSDGPPSQIKLLFDKEGLLKDVSPPHPVPNPH
jgi:hypothetical protein